MLFVIQLWSHCDNHVCRTRNEITSTHAHTQATAGQKPTRTNTLIQISLTHLQCQPQPSITWYRALSLSHARSQSTSRAVSLSGSLTFSSSFAIYIFTLNSHDTRGTSSTLSFCSQLLVSCFVFVYPFLKWQSYIFKNNKNNKYLADN